jgi:hypothetical protein
MRKLKQEDVWIKASKIAREEHLQRRNKLTATQDLPNKRVYKEKRKIHPVVSNQRSVSVQHMTTPHENHNQTDSVTMKECCHIFVLVTEKLHTSNRREKQMPYHRVLLIFFGQQRTERLEDDEEEDE